MAKVLVTIDDRLLKRIDRTARERGLTRSAYISGLAQQDIDAQIGPGAHPEVRAALRRMEELGRTATYATDEDAASLVRRMRDERTEQLG